MLGLDGGSFELVGPWLEAGELPNLDRIRAEGTAGDMQSCLPPVTCPNWRCYATGLNPGKLGVFWWEAIDRDRREIRPTSDRSSFEGREFWTLMDGRSAIVNLPTSYPPPSIDGVYVAGGPGAEQSGYTEPPELEGELVDRYDYRIHPEKLSLLSKDDPGSPCVDEILELIEQRFDLLAELVRSNEYEFVHATVFYLNVLQHFYWDHDVVKRAWRRIDDRVGDLLALEELETLFVMSDHGSNEIRTEFRVNTWLEREGYLHTTASGADVLARVGITRERVRPILGRLGIEWWTRRLVPEGIQNLLPDSDGRVSKTAKEYVVDWDRSVAVASGQGPVYVLATDPGERREVREELRRGLDGLTDDDGRSVVERALAAETVYDGPFVADGPDLLLCQAPNVHVDGAIGADGVFGEPDTWRGENKETGMFMAWGEGIATDSVPEDLHILDLAPTLLHFHGQPVPAAMDGTVRTELFAADSPAAARAVESSDVDVLTGSTGPDGTAAVEGRLEDLGYL